MKINIIKTIYETSNSRVFLRDEDWLFEQPNKKKEHLELFNYWSEKKRSKISDEATASKLVLDYDNGIKRAEVEEALKDYEYIIYNSTGNKLSEGVEKFRVIVSLKEPVLASDIKHYKKDLCKLFKGVDESTFTVGRFFCRPSKFDKDGAEVIVSKHDGALFDFYSSFSHYEVFQPFEELKAHLRASRVRNDNEKKLRSVQGMGGQDLPVRSPLL